MKNKTRSTSSTTTQISLEIKSRTLSPKTVQKLTTFYHSILSNFRDKNNSKEPILYITYDPFLDCQYRDQNLSKFSISVTLDYHAMIDQIIIPPQSRNRKNQKSQNHLGVEGIETIAREHARR